MNRIPLIVGNWKMYKTSAEARAFVSALSPLIATAQRRTLLAVPFPAIEAAVDAAKGSKIAIGAQNMHDQSEGAFTGEVSARMLKGSGASFVILGHSERRQFFAETDAFIHRKVLRALQDGLMPILCIGEMPHERDSGKHELVLKHQLEECLKGMTPEQAGRIVIAYEPIWAIGTGKTATPEIAQAVHSFIRNWLESRFGVESAEKISLLYGGSVKPDNISSLMAQADIDGVLVGGASLEAKSFAQIVNY
jgi:triosephosphate isomerase (TIM)